MISIIIPAYNASKTIKRCLDSVINQTYKDIEIIIINDGSKDNTDSIIKEYQDKRIVYIKQDNLGIGKTRNKGIKLSKGKYILFLDSDDYLPNNSLELLINKMESNKDIDLVVSDFYRVIDNTNYLEEITNFNITNLEETPELLYKINLSPWNKLYKKDLIKDIKFIEDLKYEDAPFVIEALIKSNKIIKLNKPTYYYVINNSSETTIRDNKMFDIFNILKIIDNIISNYNYLTESYNYLKIQILTNYIIQQRYQKDKNTRNKFIKEGYKILRTITPSYKSNKYFKDRPLFKSIIEKNEFLATLYCNIYASIKLKSV